jgi:formate dehydrogenase subunit gamma
MPTDHKDVVQGILDAHRGVEGSALPILHDVQEAIGYVPDEVLPLIAEDLNISRAEMYGIVTFYHDFRRQPAARHTLKVCRAEACQARGSDRVADAIEGALGIRFGETSPDGRVTLEAVYCLGLCAVGPSALLDGKVVARLTEAKVASLAKETRL